MEKMHNFRLELGELGVTAGTVDITTIKNSTKYKTYYRSKNYPDFGVLLVHVAGEKTEACLRDMLQREVENYGTLRKLGCNTPDVCGPMILVDNIQSLTAVAIIVQHIDGDGPFKAKTEAGTIKRLVQQKLSSDEQNVAEKEWEKLCDIGMKVDVHDLQVMICKTGELFVIDPDLISLTGQTILKAWSAI